MCVYIYICNHQKHGWLMATKENGLKQNITKHMLHELDTKLKEALISASQFTYN